MTMLKNYFLVAIRNLTKHRFFSALNIFGLAVSISVCLGIIMLVADQLQYDRYNVNGARIFRINTQPLNPDGTPASNLTATSPLALAPELRNSYTGIEKAVRIRRGFGNGWMEFEKDITVPVAGFFADPEFLEVFQYELQYGNPQTALTEPYSVVLTQKTARKLFDQENPVGEIIKVGKLGEYKVTGVLKDRHEKSHIVFEAIASFSTLTSLEQLNLLSANDHNWNTYVSGWVYLLLNENQSPGEIEGHFASDQQDSSASKVQRPGKTV